MLLAIDIGNTDFTIGVFQGKKLCDTFRMRTKINRTSDEYGVFILNTLQYKGYDTKDVEDVIIASVVPAVMHSFNSAIIKYFGLTPIIVGPGIRTGIRIATTNPKETGADRIVDAVAGYELYGGPVIVARYSRPYCSATSVAPLPAVSVRYREIRSAPFVTNNNIVNPVTSNVAYNLKRKEYICPL